MDLLLSFVPTHAMRHLDIASCSQILGDAGTFDDESQSIRFCLMSLSRCRHHV